MESNYEKKNRIEEALAIRGLKRIDLAEKTGICRSTISNWANQKYQPKQKSLVVLAQALNVSELWLAGYDIPMERSPERVKMDMLAKSINIVRKDERLSNLIINITKLNEQQLATVESVVNELTKLSQTPQV